MLSLLYWWKAQSFNFPRLLPWRVRTMLVCFYGSYCERHLVEQNMFTMKSKTTERKCEMATVHVLWILYKVTNTAVFSLEWCCKLDCVIHVSVNVRTTWVFLFFCLNVEQNVILFAVFCNNIIISETKAHISLNCKNYNYNNRIE